MAAASPLTFRLLLHLTVYHTFALKSICKINISGRKKVTYVIISYKMITRWTSPHQFNILSNSHKP